MSAITAKASRKMKKYAVLTREPRCFLGSFDFSWEQRKVQGVADRFDNLRIPVAANLRVHGTTPYYGANGIQDYVEGFTHDGEFVLVAEDGANDLKNYPVKCVNGRIWVNNHAHVLQGKAGIADNSFLAFAISQSDIESLLVGGGRAKLNAETLMSIEFRLPCLQEQYRIGEYLTQLNHLITLHQRKCANLCSPSQVVFSLLFATSTFSWEQRKLGDVVQITMGQSPDGSTYSDEPSDYILVQGNADLQNGWVCPRIWTTQITKKADAGDLIMSVRAPAGAMGKTAYNAVIGRGVAAIKGNEFIYQLLVKMDADGFWKTLSCGSTFESLNSDNIKNAEVKIPTTAEQIKIGGYFQQLDNLITLHQRECISFTGRADRLILTANKKRTTSSWEQRKLTEFVEFFSGLTYTPNDVQENGTLVLRSSNVSNGEVVDADNIYVNPQVVNSENVKVGDIVVVVRNGSRSLIGKHAQIKAFMPNTVIGAFMTGIRSECPEFTNALLNTSRFEEEIAMNMGATINQITGYMFSKMEFKVPCLDEQKKIGEYFEKLDNLITLHQRKPFLMKWRTSDANRNQTNRLVL